MVKGGIAVAKMSLGIVTSGRRQMGYKTRTETNVYGLWILQSCSYLRKILCHGFPQYLRSPWIFSPHTITGLRTCTIQGVRKHRMRLSLMASFLHIISPSSLTRPLTITNPLLRIGWYIQSLSVVYRAGRFSSVLINNNTWSWKAYSAPVLGSPSNNHYDQKNK